MRKKFFSETKIFTNFKNQKQDEKFTRNVSARDEKS